MNGIILVNKRVGMTSHDVVAIARKKLGTKRIGHTGTLDPFASGLLILLINDATKLAYLFNDFDKEYTGTILFGKSSDTYDCTGNILNEASVNLNEDIIDLEMNSLTKKYLQYPPIFSAKKVAGKKLYQYAREKKEVVIEPNEVNIKEFTRLSSLNNDEISFKALVSSGTYIRSLAVDLANKLGTIALLKSLIRTKIGPYSLDDAVSLEDLDRSHIIPDYTIFSTITDSVTLDDYEIKLIKNGVMLDERQIIIERPFLAYDKSHRLIGYFEVSGKNKYKLKYLFKDNYENN